MLVIGLVGGVQGWFRLRGEGVVSRMAQRALVWVNDVVEGFGGDCRLDGEGVGSYMARGALM